MDNPVVRLTWQISPRNKFAAYMDRALRLRGHAMGSLTDTNTASVVWHTPTFATGSAKWTSTVSSKLLVEAGFSFNRERYDNVYQPGIDQPRLTPGWYAGARKSDNSTGRAVERVERAAGQLSRQVQRDRGGVVRHRLAQHQGRLRRSVGTVPTAGTRRTRTSIRSTTTARRCR